jgi:hypothetical protein
MTINPEDSPTLSLEMNHEQAALLIVIVETGMAFSNGILAEAERCKETLAFLASLKPDDFLDLADKIDGLTSLTTGIAHQRIAGFNEKLNRQQED